jgi:6-pyruvoyltetrahydropterin/6-carboxytetrahydropterin synthase
MIYGSTKTYTHSVGLSCAFRQWRAQSHCKYIHGYALQVTLDFHTSEPDENGWVVDFGGLKGIKKWLEDTFDHKLLVAKSDPKFEELTNLDIPLGVAQVMVLEEVGCENFAKYIGDYVWKWIDRTPELKDRVSLRQVTIAEHEGNSAYVQYPGPSW